MTAKFIIECNGHRQVFSLDELAKSFLEAIQSAIRQEVERALPSGTTPISQRARNTEVTRPAALSKTRAPKLWA